MARFLTLLLLCFFAFPAWATVNLNTADQSELETLPGIGASKAVAILQYRTDHGAFKSVDELDNVAGIGPATLASLRDLVTVGAPGAAATQAAAAAPEAASASTTSSTSTTTSAPVASSCSATNINTADASALEALPGIGPSKAAAIVQYRTDHGKFATCDELDNVSGIGPATLAGLRDCCAVK